MELKILKNMKRKLSLIASVALSALILMSFVNQQVLLSRFMKVGDFFVLNHYDEKDKTEYCSKFVVSEYNDGKIKVVETTYNSKSEPIIVYPFDIIVDENKASYDMNFMVGASISDFKDATLENGVSKGMEFPVSAKVGDALPDASLTGYIYMGGKPFMPLELNAYNRKVGALETLDTPIGKFDCYRVDFEFSSKVGFIKNTVNKSFWFSKEFGIIKTDKHKKDKYKGKSTLFTGSK